jgi:hypothetical protein
MHGADKTTAYLPNRGWNAEESRWMYLPALHDGDLERIKAAAPTVMKVAPEEQCKERLEE